MIDSTIQLVFILLAFVFIWIGWTILAPFGLVVAVTCFMGSTVAIVGAVMIILTLDECII